MKRSTVLGIIIAVLLGTTALSWANTGYKDPVEVDWLNFTATLTAEGYVEMHWTPYNNTEDFRFYKVVRSTTNPNPVYPEDGYIKYYGNIDADSYVDTNPPKGTIYYRVCVITTGGDRWVSHVVTIENEPQGLQQIKVSIRYREDVKAVDVQWTKYTGDDFETYQVLHALTEKPGGIKEGVATKCESPEWEVIANINDPNITLFSDYDSFEPGENLYKVVVNLEGGRKIESNTATINIPSEGDGGGNGEDTGNGFKLRFKNQPAGIVDCCNCSISFSWEAEGGSGNYQYQYQLAGYDSKWAPWGTTTNATYNNLPQGSYTFMVICEDMDNHKLAVAQNTFTVRCNEEGNGTIPTADITLYQHDLLGKEAVDLKIATKAGTQKNVVDLYFGLIYPTGHFRCLILNEAGITLGEEDALQPLLKHVEMFDIDDPITLYTYVIPDDAPKGEYLWVVLFTDSNKTFFNPDWIVSYDMASFKVE